MQLQRIFCLLMAAGLPLLVHSQKLSREVTENYPNSIIRKVYEISMRIRLSAERQKTLADFFLREDSTLASSIKSGLSANNINEQINKSKKDLESLFEKNEWLIYNMSVASAVDINFISDRLNEMEKVKPLSESFRNKLHKEYMIRRRTGSTESPDREFLKVLQENTTDTAYYAALYKDQIDPRVKEYVLAYPNYKKYPKNVTRNIMREVANAVGERQRQWILLDYSMLHNSKEKDDLRTEIGNRFNPVIRRSEVRYGFNTVQSLFTTAYLNKEFLKIENPQSDTLFKYVAAISIDSFKTKFISDSGLTEYKRFERKKLIAVIGEPRYIKALGIENLQQAKTWAQDQWKGVKKYNLDKEADSTKTLDELTKYQLTLLISKAVYADDPARGEADLKMIRDHRPEILRSLELVRANPDSKQAIKSTFSW